MATNAYSANSVSFGAGANPEDLHKIAMMTTPQSVPVFSAMDAGWDCTQSHHEWPTDKLNAPQTTAVQEGAAISPAVIPALVRMGNYTQLQDRSYVISDRQQAIVKKNGLNIGVGQQMKKMVVELKRDNEKVFLTSATASAETSTAASVCGGLPYFFDTGNSTWGSTVQSVDCSSKPLSEDNHVMALLAKIYNVHDPEELTLIASPNVKKAIDKFTGGAMRELDAKSGTIYNNIKTIRTSFGDLFIIIARQASDTTVYVPDMAYFKKSFLQPIESFYISGKDFKNKHGIEFGVQDDFTMECRNPMAGGVLLNVKV